MNATNTTRIGLHKGDRKRRDGTTYRVWLRRWWGSEINPSTGRPVLHCEQIGDRSKMTKREAQRLVREKQSAMDTGKSSAISRAR